MKLTSVKNNKNKEKHYNCGFQPQHSMKGCSNKVFKNIEDLLEFAIEKKDDRYIISISHEILDYIKKNNHRILQLKNWMFIL